jgi:hypothetical protein
MLIKLDTAPVSDAALAHAFWPSGANLNGSPVGSSLAKKLRSGWSALSPIGWATTGSALLVGGANRDDSTGFLFSGDCLRKSTTFVGFAIVVSVFSATNAFGRSYWVAQPAMRACG